MLISHILTDNGGEFKNKEFEDNCRKDNIEFRNTKPYKPKTNGMVERFNAIINNGTIKSNKYQNYDELKVDLNKFLICYNFNRRLRWTQYLELIFPPLKGQFHLTFLIFFCEFFHKKYQLNPNS